LRVSADTELFVEVIAATQWSRSTPPRPARVAGTALVGVDERELLAARRPLALGCGGCLMMGPRLAKEAPVDEDTFNMSVRKFLKTLGVTAQREIELAVRGQLEAGELRGDETLEATARITVRGLPDDVVVTGAIALS
jgi:hypothetical protein